VSGAVSVRVDKNGVQYNGLKLAAKDVWLVKLKVPSVCFSYIPAGGASTTPCDKPSFAGRLERGERPELRLAVHHLQRGFDHEPLGRERGG
jgi:hypothetical protein